MGLLDTLKNLTKPFDEDEDAIEEIEAEEPVAAEAPAAQENRRSYETERSEKPQRPGRASYSDYAAKPRDNRVVSINATTQLQVVLVKPERFEQAKEIADHLREKRAVVVNLEQTQKEISRRLVDFLTGVVYAQDGNIKRVAANTFILTPYNVNIMGEQMDELENNGLYF